MPMCMQNCLGTSGMRKIAIQIRCHFSFTRKGKILNNQNTASNNEDGKKSKPMLVTGIQNDTAHLENILASRIHI